MQITSKKEKRIARLLDQFIEFEKELTPADKDNKDTLKKFYLKKCDAIKNKSDSLLFASYGPIQAPLDQGSFDKSVREFIDKAKKTRMQKDRKYFRMGIYLSENLIGCLTFEFNLIKTEGYNKEETTLDPGIFIDPAPAYRARSETGPKRWEEVLALMVAFIGGEGSEFYPAENIKIPISVTTHHLNYETKNMFANMFEEYTKNPVYHILGTFLSDFFLIKKILIFSQITKASCTSLPYIDVKGEISTALRCCSITIAAHAA